MLIINFSFIVIVIVTSSWVGVGSLGTASATVRQLFISSTWL